MAHDCRNKWDPAGEAVSLKNALVQHTVGYAAGWARNLDDDLVYLTLKTLKEEMEHARGVMATPIIGFALGSIADNTLKPKADSILGGLASHCTEATHTDASNPVGQYGWITKVDNSPPHTDFNALMQALRDCLDVPPGQGGASKSGKAIKLPKKTTGPAGKRPPRGRNR